MNDMAAPDPGLFHPRCILTGASASYAGGMLALIGSLQCNWPDHPPVLVYDLGLPEEAKARLRDSGVRVIPVPAFCPHWRRHMTWKVWAWNHAPCRSFVWLDAGVWVLRPFPEVFGMVERAGYFVRSDNTLFTEHCCPSLAENLGITLDESAGLLNCNSGLFGLCKEGPGLQLLQEAMRLALVEANLKAVAPLQLHDQSLLTILLHRHLGRLVYADRDLYGSERGPSSCKGQRLWIHRGKVLAEDRQYFIEHASKGGVARRPGACPPPEAPSLARRLRIAIAKRRGRYPSPPVYPEIYDGVRDDVSTASPLIEQADASRK